MGMSSAAVEIHKSFRESQVEGVRENTVVQQPEPMTCIQSFCICCQPLPGSLRQLHLRPSAR